MPNINDIVRVLEPFNETCPDTYVIVDVRDDGTCTLDNGIDFDPIYLEPV